MIIRVSASSVVTMCYTFETIEMETKPYRPAKPEMNMTPLIDVTFLLIIFFMIISNFIAEESVEMIVPELNKPEVRELDDAKRLVVNVAPAPYDKVDRQQNHLEWPGTAVLVQIGLKQFEVDQMELVTADLIYAVDNAPTDDEGNSKLEVLLRADAALHYDQVEPVLGAISAAGIGTVHLVSYLPDHGPSFQVDAP